MYVSVLACSRLTMLSFERTCGLGTLLHGQPLTTCTKRVQKEGYHSTTRFLMGMKAEMCYMLRKAGRSNIRRTWTTRDPSCEQ